MGGRFRRQGAELLLRLIAYGVVIDTFGRLPLLIRSASTHHSHRAGPAFPPSPSAGDAAVRRVLQAPELPAEKDREVCRQQVRRS